ncbi:MAG: glycoside hydrolase family 88 protein [Planctomycetota bacterium]
MAKVADWQLANPSKHHTADWTHGALFAGMTAWAQMAETNAYYDALLGFGEKNNWQPHRRKYHADDHAVGQMYIDLYKKYKDPKMIAGIQRRFDDILVSQPQTNLMMGTKGSQQRWNWCDALFMAPPVWAKLARVTGENRYLDYMNAEWKAITDYLFDTEENLYFRDSKYFGKREANGQKTFWSRGNGWSYGGLVRVIEEMPRNHPDYLNYVEQYKKMSAKLKAILPDDGLWHSSLLDPVAFPSIEASGSGFHCYGLAWGINHGFLEADEYLPTVIKAWQALTKCVHPGGKLGNIQPIGEDPRHVRADQTEIYGVGSFLLAGSEVYKIAVRNGTPVQKITAINPTLNFRDSETVSLEWNRIKKAVPGLTKENVAVYEFKTNRLLATQVVEDGMNSKLLFQTRFAPGEKKYFWILKQPSVLAKPKSKRTTHCRYVPEREDDFAWENDLIAFRMYGPSLWEDAVNSGVDCWLKCVDYPIIDKWYGNMKQKTYHKDWGEGYDPYHVGKSPGCGGLRIGANKEYTHSNVYDTWKVVANGPIRSIFELTYDKSWKNSGKQWVETKRISIDLGQQLCRFESTFFGPDAADIRKFAIGITTHDQKAKSVADDYRGIVYCWETIDEQGLGTGAVSEMPPADPSWIAKSDNKDESHVNLIIDSRGVSAVAYYAGFGWANAGKITTEESWKSYLEDFKKRVDNPVRVRYTQ